MNEKELHKKERPINLSEVDWMEAQTDQFSEAWKTCDRLLALHSCWMTLIAEHLQNDQGWILDY